ncbi:hypothetical protein OKA05_04105 [Luteolibacter arcticus]|uniref:ATPase n=1 Tax=Luteolibacter arcticus TaxID=1581411 RepID=A0ABT3GDL9_9BACT|nr:hypothetical protein [Luteolibacter arcticus]MCW1921722.1 hypothetical protein [Luteolibacter arcticus]
MPTEAGGDVFEIRLDSFEKRQNEKFAALRDEIDAEKARRVEETHRLAGQIQAAARSRADSGLEAQLELEQRFTRWLDQWNQGFRQYLHQREEHLIAELRGELDKTREWVNSKVETSDRGRSDQAHLQESFLQLANAARAIAEAAALQAGQPEGGER